MTARPAVDPLILSVVIAVLCWIGVPAPAASTYTLPFEIDVVRPASVRTFDGTFRIDTADLSTRGKDVLRLHDGLEAVEFRFFGRHYTGDDLIAPRAVFFDGELVGLVFKFDTPAGKRFRVKFARFERLPAGAPQGLVWFDPFVLIHASGQTPDVFSSTVAMPTPAAAGGGLALLGLMAWRRRR